MKKSKLLYALAFSSLLISCGGTPGSSTSSSSLNPTTTSPEPTTSVTPNTSSSEDQKLTLDELEKVVSSAKEKTDSIASGTITLDESDPYSEPTQKIIPFEFGKDKNGDVLHFVEFDWEMVKSDIYLMEDTSHTVVAVKKDANGKISKPYDEFEKVQFPYRNLLEYDNTFYGTENLLEGLVGFLKKNVNQDATYQLEDDQYKLSFGYISSLDAGECYIVHSSFSLGSEKEVTSMNVELLSYRSDSFMIDDELKTFYLLDDVTPSSKKTYKIEQQLGEKTFVNPYCLDDFYATSFDLYYNNEALDESSLITVEQSADVSIELQNILPSTANFEFDTLDVSVIEGNKEDDYNSASANYNSYSKKISFSSPTIGNYVVQVKSKNVTKTFKVNVIEAQPNSIGISYMVAGPQGYTSYSFSGNINAYVGVEYLINATISPNEANQELVANVDGANSADYQLVKKTIKVNNWMPERDMWCFTAKKAGTYDVILKSAVKDSVQETVHIVAEPTPTLKEVLSNDYAIKYGSSIKYYVTFEPSEDGMTGNVKIEDRSSNKVEQASYTVTKEETFYK